MCLLAASSGKLSMMSRLSICCKPLLCAVFTTELGGMQPLDFHGRATARQRSFADIFGERFSMQTVHVNFAKLCNVPKALPSVSMIG